MNKTEIANKMSRTFHKVGFQLQKKSPEILVGAGIIGVVASAVLACKATTKIDTILDETKETADRIHEATETGVTKTGESYTQEDSKKDLTITYVQTGVKLAKLYAPAVVIGAMSVTSILASHQILKKRNVALAAAYAAVDKSFKDYRERVLNRFGEQVEKELRYNIKAKEVEETIVDEKGKEKTVKKTVDVADGDVLGGSPYAVVFNKDHPEWMKDPEQNLYYLKARQSQASDMLRAKGHLFLNEVYDMLGFERTKIGAVVGWVYDSKKPIGDNYVDFGLVNIFREGLGEDEEEIILDFNAVGDILDLIHDHQNI